MAINETVRITSRQLDYILVLAGERAISIDDAKMNRIRNMGVHEASRFIEWLKTKPKPSKLTLNSGARGTYLTPDGNYYMVVKSRGSDRLYAQRLIPMTRGKVARRYAPGILTQLSDDMRLTESQARQFGMNFGVCCMCGRLLSDPGSVQAGIGPVCKQRYFG